LKNSRKKANHLRGKKKTSRWKKVLSLTLLALLCVGGAELLVCRSVDPELFEKIMLPVKHRMQVVSNEMQEAKEKLWQMGAEVGKDAPEEQFAGDPEVWTDLTTWDETVTVLEERNGAEILTGGALDIIYYAQNDKAWSEAAYGSDTIGRYGCGPTVMAMAVSSLTQQQVNPDQMAKFAKENGYWARKKGSYLSIVEGTARAYGIKAESCRVLEEDRIRQELASGHVIVALMGRGHFTKGGHFILLRGATLGGGILVADPSSRERSLFVWDVETIVSELSRSRNDGAPLWILTSNTLPTAESGSI
jgi:hypothetical protein